MGHLPFGEDFAESSTQEKHHFTGFERDVESGTDYAVDRQHSANVGRFQQPDKSAKEYGGRPTGDTVFIEYDKALCGPGSVVRLLQLLSRSSLASHYAWKQGSRITYGRSESSWRHKKVQLFPRSRKNRLIFALWFAACLAVLIVSYVERNTSEWGMAQFLLMMVLTFPAGYVFAVLGFDPIDKLLMAHGYQSGFIPLLIDWLLLGAAGYLQWFVLIPWLARTYQAGLNGPQQHKH